MDVVSGTLLCLNCMLLVLELEADGRVAGSEAGILFASVESLTRVRTACLAMDGVFDLFVVFELLLRISVERGKFLQNTANAFDSLLALGGLVDLGVLVLVYSANAIPRDSVDLHMFRAFNALRFVRLLRVFEPCQGLHVLLRACQSFVKSLFESMMLLTVFMLTLAVALGNLLQGFIGDATADFDDRLWVWWQYGTAYRSFLTVFELTFAGKKCLILFMVHIMYLLHRGPEVGEEVDGVWTFCVLPQSERECMYTLNALIVFLSFLTVSKLSSRDKQFFKDKTRNRLLFLCLFHLKASE